MATDMVCLLEPLRRRWLQQNGDADFTSTFD
jgi:hypothetical protein